jgi:hypothetical protein
MSKIPSLPAQGSFKAAQTGNSGVTMPNWPMHNAAAAAGQLAGTPSEAVAPPQNTIPGKPLDHPAKAAPAFPVAGRAAGTERDGGA